MRIYILSVPNLTGFAHYWLTIYIFIFYRIKTTCKDSKLPAFALVEERDGVFCYLTFLFLERRTFIVGRENSSQSCSNHFDHHGHPREPREPTFTALATNFSAVRKGANGTSGELLRIEVRRSGGALHATRMIDVQINSRPTEKYFS